LSLGELSQARGDTSTARRELAQAAADLERLGDPVATAAALGQRAGLEAAAALPAAAESLYRAALERLRGRTAPDVSWHLHSGLGLARRAQGDAEEAARELRLAIAEVERPSRSLTLAERRSAFLADKWEVYAQLALTERARSRPGAAFEASERLRAREMLELLARGRVAAPADTAPEVDLGAGRRDLARLVAFARGTLEPGGSLRTDSLWRGPLRQLHEYLIAPIEEAGLLAGKTRLVLVPHAELHYLPFAALVDRAGAGR